MRIVGGTHRGRPLLRVGKDTTRETADMVKVSIFNMLRSKMDGVVLDLFSGSGAYAFESLSRGAFFAYAVDHDKDAIKTIHENAKKLGFEDKVFVTLKDYERFIEGLSETVRFDYIFLDPPYNVIIYKDVIMRLLPYLNQNGYIICESKKQVIIENTFSSLDKIKEKVYGIKRVSIFLKK
jgi:16S rRNA (guanine966-N2)-methyltransferase